jgi:RimJ/RimL family protein N-acetyltransferase
MSAWQPGTPLQLETRSYLLRSLAAADATDEYISWWNDADVQRSLGFEPRGWDWNKAVRHIQRFDNRQSFHIGIFPKGEDLPVGFISAFVEPGSRALTNTVIGNKEYWGRRVVLEIRERLIDFLFDDIGVAKVYGRVDGRNFPSIFNYKAQGFTCEGVLRKHSVAFDGERCDTLMFGLLRDEWRAQKEKGAERRP